MRILLAIILSIFLVMGVAEASFFDVDVEVIERVVGEEGYSRYNITIYNFAENQKVFSNSLTPAQATSWSLIPGSVVVPGNQDLTYELRIRPGTILRTGSYSLEIRIRSEGEAVTFTVPATIPGEGILEGYPASADTLVKAPASINPRNDLDLDVEIRNRNQRNLENLTLTVTSDFFTKQIKFDLPPLGIETKNLQIELPDKQEPGLYKFYVEVYHPESEAIISYQSLNLEIESYSTITPVLESSSRWFKVTETISLYNEGNFEREKEVALRSPWYQRIFLSTDEPYELVKIDGRSNLQFSPSVTPGDTYQINVYKDYRPLAILILLAILGVISYYVFRSPLVLKKKVYMTGKDDEGVKKFKIRVYIKNRTNMPIQELKITDYLPRITEYVKTESQGALAPTKVTKTSRKGVLIHWEIGTLEGLEERILTYEMKSTLGIVGNLSLPTAKAKFKDFKERIRQTRSSEASFEK